MSPTTAAPARSLEQRMEALANANRIRTVRASYKRDLKAGRASLVLMLLNPDPPDWAANAKVFDLLLAVPRLGQVKVNKALNVTRISPSKTLGGLTMRQRVDLAAHAQLHGAGRSAGLDPSMYPLTGFQERVLGLIHTRGALAPATIAPAVVADVRHARQTVQALQSRGLLDECGSMTERGRALMQDDQPSTSEPVRVACAA